MLLFIRGGRYVSTVYISALYPEVEIIRSISSSLKNLNLASPPPMTEDPSKYTSPNRTALRLACLLGGRFLPMAEKIQKIRRTKKTDPAIREKWTEVMQVLQEVREEAGERGLGLTYIYHLGMRACLDFGHPEAVLQLFDEVICGSGRGGDCKTDEVNCV